MPGEGKIKVLIVDDHAILREGIRYLLHAAGGIEVTGEAEDGQAALEKLAGAQPDVVLMDVAMPRMNGIDATRAIKAARPDLPVLILSMHDSEEYILPILKAGASGYVLKRAAAQELVSALRAAVAGQTVLHPEVARCVMASLSDRSPGRPAPAPAPALHQPPVSEHPALAPLTEREREVLTLIAQGLTNQEIARRLYISIKTVQAHRANIMEKLDLHDAVELTKFAIRTGLVKLD